MRKLLRKHKNEELLQKKLNSFSLVELMVVLVIIGILVLIALPNLLPVVTKAKTTEAQIQLKHVYSLQKNYFYVHSRYSNDLEQVDYIQEKLTTEGGTANYKIEVVEAGTTTFKVRATSIVDFDGDGVYNVWEIDENQQLIEVTKD